LHEITMRRCTFSRSTMFGPCSRRTSASSRTGTMPGGVSIGRSRHARSRAARGSNLTIEIECGAAIEDAPTVAPAKLVSIASATSAGRSP
jgi:hypothetical protein